MAVEDTTTKSIDPTRIAALTEAEQAKFRERTHASAERYERALADLFDIQDDITRSVAAETQTQLQLVEAAAGGSRSFSDSKARDLSVRAWARLYDQTPEAIIEASDLVEQAIHLEPLNPVAHRARASAYDNSIRKTLMAIVRASAAS